MNICMITPHYNNIRGGGEISVKLLVDKLRGNGHNVDVVHDKSMVNMFLWLKNNYSSYDIIHSYNMNYNTLLGLITKKYNINSVATLNGIVYNNIIGDYGVFGKFRNNICNEFTKHIKIFTTLCRFYKESWAFKNIHIINNMVDDSFKVEKHIDSDKLRVLFVGNYSNWRDYDTLRRIPTNFKNDIIFNSVGSKVLGYNYIQSDYSNMNNVYASNDVLILPYKYPLPCSRVLIEGMQNRMPVVTTGNDVYSNIILNDRNGFLVKNNLCFIGILGYLNNNRDVLKEIGENAFKRVNKVCNSNVIVNKYVKIYENLN